MEKIKLETSLATQLVSQFTMKIAKKVEGFCTSAVAIYTDSVWLSSIDHWGAVGKLAQLGRWVGNPRRLGPPLGTEPSPGVNWVGSAPLSH